MVVRHNPVRQGLAPGGFGIDVARCARHGDIDLAAASLVGRGVDVIYAVTGKIDEQSLVSDDDLSQVKKAFDLNGYVGIVYFAATALSLYLG